MAQLLIFEDDYNARANIRRALAGTEHTIAGEAITMRESYEWLTRLALHEVIVDGCIVDANLDHRQETFRFTPPERIVPDAAKKRLRRNVKPVPNPYEIVVETDTGCTTARGQHINYFGGDGRQIVKIIRTLAAAGVLEPAPVIIGNSAIPASGWAGEVDHDLTKAGILSGLLPLLDQLEMQK